MGSCQWLKCLGSRRMDSDGGASLVVGLREGMGCPGLDKFQSFEFSLCSMSCFEVFY